MCREGRAVVGGGVPPRGPGHVGEQAARDAEAAPVEVAVVAQGPPGVGAEPEQAQGGGAGLALEADQRGDVPSEAVGGGEDDGGVLADVRRAAAAGVPRVGVQRWKGQAGRVADDLAQGQDGRLAGRGEGGQGAAGGGEVVAGQVEGEDLGGQFVEQQADGCPCLAAGLRVAAGGRAGERAGGVEGEGRQRPMVEGVGVTGALGGEGTERPWEARREGGEAGGRVR